MLVWIAAGIGASGCRALDEGPAGIRSSIYVNGVQDEDSCRKHLSLVKKAARVQGPSAAFG